MIIALTLFNLAVIALIARMVWRKLAVADSLVYWSALILRLSAGIAVGLVYKYYYNGIGDTFALFNEAVLLSKSDAAMVTSEPRSLFFIHIVRIVNFVTGSNYWLTSLWFSLFSFICSYRLVVKLDELFPPLRTASRAALLFLPSVVFWSSGIIKESLAFGAVEIFALYFLTIMHDEKLDLKFFVEIVLAFTLLLYLKYYWAAVLIPSLVSAIRIKKMAPKKFAAGWFVLTFLVLCLAISLLHPNFYLSRFLSVIVENHNAYVHLSNGNLIHYYNLSPDWTSIIINSPWALVSGLFRPFIFEVSSVTGIIAAVENLLVLILFVWKIKNIRMPSRENRLIIFAVLTYIVVLCIFLALSTPNLGTLSRYRVGFLSFFVLLILADHPILNLINGKPSNHIRS